MIDWSPGPRRSAGKKCAQGRGWGGGGREKREGGATGARARARASGGQQGPFARGAPAANAAAANVAAANAAAAGRAPTRTCSTPPYPEPQLRAHAFADPSLALSLSLPLEASPLQGKHRPPKDGDVLGTSLPRKANRHRRGRRAPGCAAGGGDAIATAAAAARPTSALGGERRRQGGSGGDGGGGGARSRRRSVEHPRGGLRRRRRRARQRADDFSTTLFPSVSPAGRRRALSPRAPTNRATAAQSLSSSPAPGRGAMPVRGGRQRRSDRTRLERLAKGRPPKKRRKKKLSTVRGRPLLAASAQPGARVGGAGGGRPDWAVWPHADLPSFQTRSGRSLRPRIGWAPAEGKSAGAPLA